MIRTKCLRRPSRHIRAFVPRFLGIVIFPAKDRFDVTDGRAAAGVFVPDFLPATFGLPALVEIMAAVRAMTSSGIPSAA
jgi:hypothetical protein